MLKDVLEFVQSRTAATEEVALREINYAWQEIYAATDDFPNSLQEITVEPIDSAKRISLPYYVYELKGVKQASTDFRVALNTPRPYYQNNVYWQSPYTWRVLGITPIKTSILNATTLNLSIAETEDKRFSVFLTGPTDNSESEQEEIIFEIGNTEKETTKRFTDLASVSKNALTVSNVAISGANGEDFGFIPNNFYESRYTLVQIMDKCDIICNDCNCFDVLYKRLPQPLVNKYESLPNGYEQIVMNKAVELILMPKKDELQHANAFAQKAAILLMQNNRGERATDKILDIGTSRFESRYYGYL